MRLPDMPLPVFSGDFNEWITFRQRFQTLITQNNTLNNVEKLYYLRASLRDEALSLQSTNDTFASLWSALVERFEVKRVIADNHINQLFVLRKIAKESSVELRQLIDTVVKNIRVLHTIDLPMDKLSEMVLVNLVCNRLDSETRKAYEIQIKPDVFPKWQDMLTFLNARCHILEGIENSGLTIERSPYTKQSSPSTSRYNKPKDPPFNISALAATIPQQSDQCSICRKPHFLSQCNEFLKLTPELRFAHAKSLNLCYNCLSNRHSLKDCKSGLCRHCHSKHHTLLHLGPLQSSNDPPTAEDQPATNSNNEPTTSLVATGNQILLSTAVVRVLDANGTPMYCRALLDSGSQSNFMTERLAQTLRLRRTQINVPVYGINERSTAIRHKLLATIESRVTKYSAELEFLVISNITGLIPATTIHSETWNIPKNILLADPLFATPQTIDILLGAEIFFEVWSHQQFKLSQGLPTLQGSVFGWIVTGKLTNTFTVAEKLQNNPTTTFCGCISTTYPELIDQVKRFGELESCTSRPSMSVEEKQVEEHFVSTHYRQPDGRYVVFLPTKPNICQLGASQQMALKRFEYLERKLNRNPDLKQKYCDFIEEYTQHGHMIPSSNQPTTSSAEQHSYFRPHHGVLKPDSSTKLRVVFDAFVKSQSGLSLNDVLKIGATDQQEVVEILLRFRRYQYVFTADIGKMCRQIGIDDSHQILRRENPADDKKKFTLKIVTYGTASAF
jgi:hypothetical protein